MGRPRARLLVLVVVILCGAVWASASGLLGKGAKGVSARVQGLGAAVEVANIVHATYVHSVTRSSLLSSYLRTGSIDKMLETLGDPYTRYMNSEAWADLREETSGSFQGIGVIIGVKDKHITVISPIDGTPGFRAGLEPEDRILTIDGRSTDKMTTQQAADLIRGTRGTKVNLKVQRRGEARVERFMVAITRDDIKLRSVSGEPLAKEPNIGYVKIASFSETTSKDLSKELAKLREAQVQGLILDLRYNPGGLLTQAIAVCGEFLKKGTPVLHVVGRAEAKATYSTTTAGGYWGAFPIVVLTNEGTASASEIVTGALQDYHIATVVGTKTFGKGLIQTVIAMRSGGGVTVTTAKYLTAKKRAINLIGIKPDVLVKLPQPPAPKKGAGTSRRSTRGAGLVEDTQLEAATEVLRDKIRAKTRHAA